MEFTTGPDGGISRVRLYPPLVDEVSELRLVTPMPGVHMALNALAAVLAGHAVLGQSVPLAQIAEGIAEFSGVRRRFEYRGARTASARLRRLRPSPDGGPRSTVRSTGDGGRRPGRRSVPAAPVLRTQEFAREFATALRLADEVIVADVYGAREEPLPGVNGGLIAAHMRGRGRFVPDLSELVPAVLDVVAPGDIVLTLGAGDITMQGPEILAALGAGVSRARRWVTAVAIAVLVGGLAAVAYFSPLMSVRTVSVQGLDSPSSVLSQDQVLKAAQVPKGRPLLQVNTSRAASRVAAIPAVETARVRRQYPSTIEVIVVERMPVVRVETDRAIHILDRLGVPYRHYDRGTKLPPDLGQVAGAGHAQPGSDRSVDDDGGPHRGQLPPDLRGSVA